MFFLWKCQQIMREESKHQTAICREVGSSVDGQLLARFVDIAPKLRLAELGAGCGEVALQVAKRDAEVEIDALELQPELVEIANLRVVASRLSEQVRIIAGDLRDPPKTMAKASYDRVFANPPFFKIGAGRLPPDRLRRAARFEQEGRLVDFIRCGADLLREGGLFQLVHRPERLVEIFATLNDAGLVANRIIPVQDVAASKAVLLLIAARKGGYQPMVVEPAWIINLANGG